jgi:hypothetical protein
MAETMKTRYTFSHRAGGTYYWFATKPTDSRTEMITCNVEWFWTGKDSKAAAKRRGLQDRLFGPDRKR